MTDINLKPISIKKIAEGQIEFKQQVVIQGWVRSRRDSKGGFSFLTINDGSCFECIQVIADNHLANYETEILNITTGCALTINGLLVPSQGKQQFEIQAEQVTVVGWVENPEQYPIAKKNHSYEFLREVAHLRPRTNTFGAITRIRHQLSQAIHQFFHEQGFYWVNTPILTGNDCEGAGTLFRVSTLDYIQQQHKIAVESQADFFQQPAYLTVSGQLHVESYCLALSKVYTFGPTFRAENSHTSRHLAEFWMIEPEIAFANLTSVINLAESFLKNICNVLLEQCAVDLDFFTQRVDKECKSRLQSLVNCELIQMEYTEAINILQRAKQNFEYPVSWGIDLQSEHERYLAESHVKGPLVIINYPLEIKAFYMRRNDDNKTCAAMDLIVPGIGELMGGSQREERLSVLDELLAQHQIKPEDLAWYRDLRQYGTVPHGGFGLGFERLLSYITGMSNIRDVIPFPRVPGSLAY